MLKSFLNLFRLEKALYHWRERPSPSAFMMNFERKYRPKMFRIRVLKSIYFSSVWAIAIIVIFVVLSFLSRSINEINLLGLFIGSLIIFIGLSFGFTAMILASTFSNRAIGLFDKVIRLEGDNTSWKYQDFEFYAFTQMIYPSHDLRYPCLVLVNSNQGRLIAGIPNPEVALRVTEILSSRMTLRTDYEAIMLEEEKT